MRPVSTCQTILVQANLRHAFATAAGIEGKALAQKTLLLPGIERSEGDPPPWARVGETRRHLLTDGTSVHEELTAFARDEYYAYRITDFEGTFGKLVSEALGEWRFDWRGPELTEIAWTYAFTPSGLVQRLIVSMIVKLLWAGYLQAGLKQVKEQAEASS
jgi:hypothetical protein